jgi:uncharacterized protein (DUF849 family)
MIPANPENHKVIINACLTGMVPTKAENRHVPVSVNEIIKSALESAKLGASIVHIHPRDESGKPTWKKDYFARIIGGIKEKNDKLLISATTSGRFWSEFEKRSACLELKGDLKPDLASLTVGSMNFIRDESMSSPNMIEKLAKKMQDNGIKIEFEIFEPGMLHKADFLLEREIISDKKPYFNIFMGSLGTSPLEPTSLAAMLNLLPKESVWAVAGVGRYQLDANMLGLAFGGNVRTGLEDNLYFDRDRRTLASNVLLLKRIKSVINLMDLEIAGPAETRKLLSIN